MSTETVKVKLSDSRTWRYALPSGVFESLDDPNDDSVYIIMTRKSRNKVTLHYFDADSGADNGTVAEGYSNLDSQYVLSSDQDGCCNVADYLKSIDDPMYKESFNTLDDRYYHLTGEDLPKD